MLRSLIVSSLFVCSCTSGGGVGDTSLPDGSTHYFSAPPEPDFSFINEGPPPDMASSSTSGDVTSAHGAIHRYVVNKILLPQVKTDDSIDLNGDGRVDNQLGNVLGALASQGLTGQSQQDQLVMSGQVVHLVTVQSADPTLMNDSQVGGTWLIGAPQPNPDFSGNGTFSVDTTQPEGATLGTLANGLYQSNNPITTTHPVLAEATLVFALGAAPVRLPLHGAHLRMKASTGGLMSGSIQGSIKNSEIQTTIIPSIASALNASLHPTDVGHACTLNTDCKSSGMCTGGHCALSDNAKQIKMIFDVGDGNGGSCTNPDGTLGKPNDNTISVCEVSDNQLIANLFAPDVQIYDASGNYAPNPSNAHKDSMSVGLGFTAVPASF